MTDAAPWGAAGGPDRRLSGTLPTRGLPLVGVKPHSGRKTGEKS